MSALGSGGACPTAFITFCPKWRLQRIQFIRRVPACSLPEWLVLRPLGLYRLGRTSRSVVTLSPGASISWLPFGPPGSSWHVVLRPKTPAGTGCRFGGQVHTTYSRECGLLAGRLVGAVGQPAGLLHPEEGGGGPKPKKLCAKNGPYQSFLEQISFFPTMKSGSRGGKGVPPPRIVVGRSNTSLSHPLKDASRHKGVGGRNNANWCGEKAPSNMHCQPPAQRSH